MPIVLEAAQKSQRPFANASAGKEYFASEAHYRLLAGQIRDQLQEHGGCVLLTGNPAPNCDLLLRQLAVVGPSRCRATVIRCTEQMTITGLLENYRRLIGGTIEAVTRRVASWSDQGRPATRGQEIDILILEEAENLAHEVLRHLCRPAKETHVHWPPRLLIASESLIERLAEPSLEAAGATLTGRFSLDRLAQREVGSFIRYQLMSADLDRLELFKPQVVELIEMYADGDPVIVNGLARRILRIVPSLTNLFRVPDEAEEAAQQVHDQRQDRVSAPAASGQLLAEEAASDPVPLVVNADSGQPPAPDAPSAFEVLPGPASLLDAVAPQEAPPIDVSSPIVAAEVPEPITEAHIPEPLVEKSVPAPIVEASVPVPPVEVPQPVASVAAPIVEPTSPASIIEAAPPAPIVEPEFEAPTVEIPEPVASVVESSAAVKAEPEAEAPPAEDVDRTEAPLAVEPPIVPVPEPVPSVIEKTLPSEIAGSDQAPSAAEIAPATLAPPMGEMIERPAVLSFDPDRAPTDAANDRDTPPAAAARPRRLRGVAGFSLAALSVIIAFTGTVVVTQRHGGDGSYFDQALQFAKKFIRVEAPPRTVEASAPVPKDLGAQRLRTTTDTKQNLLTAVEPTAPRETTSASRKEPAATAVPNNPTSRPSAPATPAPAPPKPVEATPAPTPPPKVVAVAPPAISAPAQPSVVGPASQNVATTVPPAIVLPAPPNKEASEALPPVELRVSNIDRVLASAEIDQLLRRGDQLLASGDIIAARHYFEMVTEAGDMRAALRLGKTYDPAFLQQNGVRGIVGNPAMAKSWYLKAIAAGDKDADMRLLQLMTLYPN